MSYQPCQYIYRELGLFSLVKLVNLFTKEQNSVSEEHQEQRKIKVNTTCERNIFLVCHFQLKCQITQTVRK